MLIFSSLQKFVAEYLASGKSQHERFTSGMVAASFTSTSLDLANDNRTRMKTPDEVAIFPLLRN